MASALQGVAAQCPAVPSALKEHSDREHAQSGHPTDSASTHPSSSALATRGVLRGILRQAPRPNHGLRWRVASRAGRFDRLSGSAWDSVTNRSLSLSTVYPVQLGERASRTMERPRVGHRSSDPSPIAAHPLMFHVKHDQRTPRSRRSASRGACRSPSKARPHARAICAS